MKDTITISKQDWNWCLLVTYHVEHLLRLLNSNDIILQSFNKPNGDEAFDVFIEHRRSLNTLLKDKPTYGAILNQNGETQESLSQNSVDVSDQSEGSEPGSTELPEVRSS